MNAKIINYVDFKKVSELLEGFNNSTRMVTAILDLDGNILSKSGWRKICTDFHRINHETQCNCTLSDTILAGKLLEEQRYHTYKCFNGLIDVAIPIIIEGNHIANIFSGQFLFEEPDIEYFKKQAKKYGFDEEAYLEALTNVPIVSKDNVEVVMDFLLLITKMIIEMTNEKLEQENLIEEIKKNEAVLFETQRKLQETMKDLLESQRIAHIGTWRLYVESGQTTWSEEIYKIFNFDPISSIPPFTEHRYLFTKESWDRFSSAIEECKTSAKAFELELETVVNHGLHGWIWVRGEAEKDFYDKIVSLKGTAQDITARKNFENDLFYLSYHDHLTGLHNRRFFEKLLRRKYIEENLPLSILMFDVNGLKLVNDSFGHHAGDMLLKKAAETIKNECRENDVVARVGGDEFVLLLPKTDKEQAIHIVNRINEKATKERVSNVELSISYGYDTLQTNRQSIADVISNAEDLMYRNKLYERSSLRSKSIDLIMTTLFEKSSREANHSNRVGVLCESIAKNMNLEKDMINKIKTAGRIHDIGKIGIDESILNKPSRLTSEEWKEIIRHPEIGWKILSSSQGFSELAQFVLNHHEHWDGSGYPNGLKGEEIHLVSRIISIADAYDAMTSKRTYRKEMSKDEAILELKRCSGNQFDPSIVDVFLRKVLF